MNIDNITQFLARVIVLLIALPMHESAHGLVAYWLGDPTAKDARRITLNPIRHLDIVGGLCLLFAGVGWAKPVPIDPRYFRKPKRDMALSALAGPVSNFLLAVLAIILLKVYLLLVPADTTFATLVALIFYYMVFINIALAIFNMLPVPPFDGSRIFLTFLPAKWYFGLMKYERYIMIGIFFLMVIGILDTPLSFLYNGVFKGLDWATSWIQ